MSIFKQTFSPNINAELVARQEAMVRRSPKDLQYINSRNSWIRMSSAVDIYKATAPRPPTIPTLKDKGNYDNTLARKYILQGGVLTEHGTLKSGVGGFDNAYSDLAADGVTKLRLGIRPMPGITGIDVKSRGAYGSLRDVTVNFICWDIHQLEDLELLYMRPGYTVLVEWGWAPYLDTKGELNTTVQFYDIVNNPKPKEKIFEELDAKMKENGNYEAMFGTIKNYSWSARPDGGYDCTTTIVSLGEIIESLKVNYAPSAAMTSIKKNGLITPTISASTNGAAVISDLGGKIANIASFGYTDTLAEKLEENYSKNILAGIFFELYDIAYRQFKGYISNTSDEGESVALTCTPPNKSPFNINFFHKTINIHGKESKGGDIGDSDEQIYISLETLCNIINSFVTLRDKDNNTTYIDLSVLEKDAILTNQNTGEGYLLALAHPLQVSTDPTICLIRNMLWAKGIKITANSTIDPNASGFTADKGKSLIQFAHNLPDPDALTDRLISLGCATNIDANKFDSKRKDIANWIKDIIQGPPNARYSANQIDQNVKEIAAKYIVKYQDKNYKVKQPNPLDVSKFGLTVKNVGKTIDDIFYFDPTTFYQLLEDDYSFNLDDDLVKLVITPEGIDPSDATKAADGDPVQEEQKKIDEQNEKLKEETDAAKDALSFLKNIPRPFFVDDNYKTELGIIGGIFLNLNFLYNEAVSDAMAAQDKKEKNDVSLYDFIKSILHKISESIGNQNNFDIFVEPNGKTARIIDINYVDREDAAAVYEKASLVEIHNLKSTVRSYKFESKIFPDQSAQVAIGAQVEGGALGLDTTTLVDFNRRVRDRIIPIKDMPTSDAVADDAKAKVEALLANLEILYKYFARLKTNWFVDADFDADKANEYNNALKDLINFIKSVAKSKTNGKAIIPTNLSIDMDGLGGLIIGNIFKISEDLLPKGYKGSDMGAKVGYVINGLGHTVGDSDWVTKIDSQFIILDSPNDLLYPIDYENITISIEAKKENEILAQTPTIPVGEGGGKKGGGVGGTFVITKQIKTNLDSIEKACIKLGLTDQFLIKALKANILKETAGVPRNENLDYSTTNTARIKKFFTTRAAPLLVGVEISETNTLKKAGKWPGVVVFGDYLYGNLSGKTGVSFGNTAAGDGYAYRGRSYIGITGKSQYEDYSKELKQDFVNNPDSMNTPDNAALTTVLYITKRIPELAGRYTKYFGYVIDKKNPVFKSQLDANLFITNAVAGSGNKLTRPVNPGSPFVEILAKVDNYSGQV